MSNEGPEKAQVIESLKKQIAALQEAVEYLESRESGIMDQEERIHLARILRQPDN